MSWKFKVNDRIRAKSAKGFGEFEFIVYECTDAEGVVSGDRKVPSYGEHYVIGRVSSKDVLSYDMFLELEMMTRKDLFTVAALTLEEYAEKM
jgi:hypothetical protein